MKLPISVKLGVLFGITNSTIWYIISKKLGNYSADLYFNMNFVTIFILVIGIFLSIFITRRQNNGFIVFKGALKAGMLYSIVLSIIYAFFSYLYHNFITPDTVDYFVSIAKKEAEALKLTGVELENFMAMSRSFFDAYRLIPSVLFFGLIISLLAGAVLTKKDPSTSENQ